MDKLFKNQRKAPYSRPMNPYGINNFVNHQDLPYDPNQIRYDTMISGHDQRNVSFPHQPIFYRNNNSIQNNSYRKYINNVENEDFREHNTNEFAGNSDQFVKTVAYNCYAENQGQFYSYGGINEDSELTEVDVISGVVVNNEPKPGHPVPYSRVPPPPPPPPPQRPAPPAPRQELTSTRTRKLAEAQRNDLSGVFSEHVTLQATKPVTPQSSVEPLKTKANETGTSTGSSSGTNYKEVLDKQRSLHSQGARIFTGPVEKILKWNKMQQDLGVEVLYEVIAKCLSIRPGRGCEKLLLLRDTSGPVLQATYYEIDFHLPDIQPGSTVRVVGKMVGCNRMLALKVRAAGPFEAAALPRLGAISQHVLAKLRARAPSAGH